MATEAKSGEVTLVYNLEDKAYAVALTKEQHSLLQHLVKGLGNIQVIKALEVDYKQIKKASPEERL